MWYASEASAKEHSIHSAVTSLLAKKVTKWNTKTVKKQIPLSALIKLISFYALIIGIIGIILFVGITLTKKQSHPSATPTLTVTPTIQPRPRAKEGEFCGGIAGILCIDGYTCQYSNTYPDAGGKCIKKTSH